MSRPKVEGSQSEKTILSLCSGTGAWERPYVEAGYNIISITLPELDVRDYVPPESVYGVLAAPPCTEFAISGARWWKSKPPELLEEALHIVNSCLEIIRITNPVFWCLENPVGRLTSYLGTPVVYFNPCDYGDPWTKKTCLWGKFNVPKKNKVDAKSGFLPHKILSNPVSKNQINKLIECGYLPENYETVYGKLKDRQTIRAITPSGFANAFFESNR